MTKSIVHITGQMKLFDPRSFNGLGSASAIKLELISKSFTFAPRYEIYYFRHPPDVVQCRPSIIVYAYHIMCIKLIFFHTDNINTTCHLCH